MASISRIDRSSSTTRIRGGRRSAATSGTGALDVLMSLCRDRGPRRQVDRDGRAVARLRADLNLAVVVRDDAMDDGEPEAAPLREPTVEGLEQALEFVGRDAD